MIERATGYLSFKATDASQFVFVSVRRAGNDDTSLPTSYQSCGPAAQAPCPASVFFFNQEVLQHYDASETPVVRFATSHRAYPHLGSVAGSPLAFNNTVTASGYLVDCVSAVWKPIAP